MRAADRERGMRGGDGEALHEMGQRVHAASEIREDAARQADAERAREKPPQ